MKVLTVNDSDLIITATGQLDKTTVREQTSLVPVLQSGKNYQCDLGKLDSIDSAGLAFLINLISRHRQTGGDIQLLNCGEQTLQLIELSSLSDILAVSDNNQL